MHERERHRIILDALEVRAVATVPDLVRATHSSPATIRRDLTALAAQARLRKLRGGAEALQPRGPVTPDGRRGAAGPVAHLAQKRAIGHAAAALCREGDAIIVNGGTTTFEMVHALAGRHLQVLTNSFGMADHLLRHSRCTVHVPFGAVYREQNIILSPFADDGTVHFRARRMFMGAKGISRLGLMEEDALVIASEQRLMNQADELIVLVDASKFAVQSSMILAPLARATRIVTDARISDADRRMVTDAGIDLIVADGQDRARQASATA